MKDLRYEDYSIIDEGLPCLVYGNIVRTKNILSDMANWHENLEIQFCCEGSGYVLLNGKKTDINKDDIVVVNSDVVHYTGTHGYIKYHCIILNTEFSRQSGINFLDLQFNAIFKSETFRELIIDTVKTFENKDIICRKAKLQSLILNLLIFLRINQTENKSDNKSQRFFGELKNAVFYIQNHYSEKITLDEISKYVYMDKYTLSRNFKKITGDTVVHYINNYRCKKAIEYIKSGKDVNEAARLCGFNNISFFTKTFKKSTGKLPSEYKHDKGLGI